MTKKRTACFHQPTHKYATQNSGKPAMFNKPGVELHWVYEAGPCGSSFPGA
jgi:hypothetical protein